VDPTTRFATCFARSGGLLRDLLTEREHGGPQIDEPSMRSPSSCNLLVAPATVRRW
jgi:hypothetical protein